MLDYIPSWLTDAYTLLKKVNKCVEQIETNRLAIEDIPNTAKTINSESIFGTGNIVLQKPLFYHHIQYNSSGYVLDLNIITQREEQIKKAGDLHDLSYAFLSGYAKNNASESTYPIVALDNPTSASTSILKIKKHFNPTTLEIVTPSAVEQISVSFSNATDTVVAL